MSYTSKRQVSRKASHHRSLALHFLTLIIMVLLAVSLSWTSMHPFQPPHPLVALVVGGGSKQ